MKKIVCEICENTEFVKEDDSFVCQGCGTKYTLQAVKSLMVDDETPINVNSNLYINAKRAFEDKRYREAEELFGNILNFDVDNYEAMSYQALSMLALNKTNREKIQQAGRITVRALNTARNKIAINKDLEAFCSRYLSDFSDLVFGLESFCFEVFRRADATNAEKNIIARRMMNVNGLDVYSVSYVHSSVDLSYVDAMVSDYYGTADLSMVYLNLVMEYSELQINVYEIIVNAFADINTYSKETYSLLDNVMKTARNIVFITDRYSEKSKHTLELFEKQNEICTKKRMIVRDAYWAAHPEEKNNLEKEISELKNNMDMLKSSVKAAYSDEDYMKRENTIAQLSDQLAYLGYDREYEKAELEERIANLRYVNDEKLREIQEHNYNISSELEKLKWKLSELNEKIENPK